MSITIPQPFETFRGGAGLPVLPANTFRDPPEGKLLIPVDIPWPGNVSTYQINVNGLTTQPFSQVVMLDVDNGGCGAPVTFIFPDTGDTLQIPPSSSGLFPVFTASTSFYVSAPEALATDVTRFRILNYRQEPVALPPPQFTQIGKASNITAAGDTVILAPAVNGTLAGWSANITIFNAAPGADSGTISLVDTSTGAILDSGTVIAGQLQGASALVFNVSGSAVRFKGGLKAVATIGVGLTSYVANVFVRYRIP